VIEILFVGLTLLYLWFGSKVDQWETIGALGFKLEAPQGFLAHARVYHLIRIAVLLGAAACLLGMQAVPWYIGAAALCVAWFATTWIGQWMAFATYRRIWLEAAADPESTPQRKSFAESEANRSYAELVERVMQAHQRVAR